MITRLRLSESLLSATGPSAIGKHSCMNTIQLFDESETSQGFQLRAGTTTSSGIEARLPSTSTVQLASRSLVRLLYIDQVPRIAATKVNEIRPIVALTNNWNNYGALGVY